MDATPLFRLAASGSGLLTSGEASMTLRASHRLVLCQMRHGSSRKCSFARSVLLGSRVYTKRPTEAPGSSSFARRAKGHVRAIKKASQGELFQGEGSMSCRSSDRSARHLKTQHQGRTQNSSPAVYGATELFVLFNAIQPVGSALSSTAEQTDVIPPNQFAPSYLFLAGLDPATAKILIGVTGPFLSAFGFLFIARIVMSWYPKLPVGQFPYVIAYAPTEPILGVTRRLIPPVGGVDVTPVVWFGLLSFLNEILVGPQGLLVLLSQQVQ